MIMNSDMYSSYGIIFSYEKYDKKIGCVLLHKVNPGLGIQAKDCSPPPPPHPWSMDNLFLFWP
jgi:hypothetical protein